MCQVKCVSCADPEDWEAKRICLMMLMMLWDLAGEGGISEAMKQHVDKAECRMIREQKPMGTIKKAQNLILLSPSIRLSGGCNSESV